MSKKQETISDIVAEMRRLNPEKFLSTPWYCEPLPNRMRSYADRIEEAAKSIEADRDNWRRQALDEDARANAATIKDSLTVGDAAAIREALEALVGVIDNYDSKNPLWWHSGAKGVKPLKDARAAIAEPSRNRDDLEVCSDYDESDESRREDREAYEVDKADAKRKGEW